MSFSTGMQFYPGISNRLTDGVKLKFVPVPWKAHPKSDDLALPKASISKTVQFDKIDSKGLELNKSTPGNQADQKKVMRAAYDIIGDKEDLTKPESKRPVVEPAEPDVDLVGVGEPGTPAPSGRKGRAGRPAYTPEERAAVTEATVGLRAEAARKRRATLAALRATAAGAMTAAASGGGAASTADPAVASAPKPAPKPKSGSDADEEEKERPKKARSKRKSAASSNSGAESSGGYSSRKSTSSSSAAEASSSSAGSDTMTEAAFNALTKPQLIALAKKHGKRITVERDGKQKAATVDDLRTMLLGSKSIKIKK